MTGQFFSRDEDPSLGQILLWDAYFDDTQDLGKQPDETTGAH